MKAETHLEVYRPFQGQLHESPLRFWPLLTSGLRTALKQRKALLLLYLPALIVTVILCFVVYGMFAAKSAVESKEGLDFQEQLVAGMVITQAEQMLSVVNLILGYSRAMGVFSLLAVAWFASGLFCEDRKAGAHQLYFARPLTRLDYFLGKFLTASFFSLCGVFVPLFSVCLAAVFFSPDWSFLEEQWDMFPRVAGFSLTWTVVISSLVLAASSLASRKSFALLGVLGFVMMSLPVSAILGQFVDKRLFSLALIIDLEVLSRQFLGKAAEVEGVSAASAWTAMITLVVLCWTVIALRLRRLEVVA